MALKNGRRWRREPTWMALKNGRRWRGESVDGGQADLPQEVLADLPQEAPTIFQSAVSSIVIFLKSDRNHWKDLLWVLRQPQMALRSQFLACRSLLAWTGWTLAWRLWRNEMMAWRLWKDVMMAWRLWRNVLILVLLLLV